jgi:hypothetical protein
VRIALGVAAVLVGVAVAIRPGPDIVARHRDIWDTYEEFAVAFAALPVALLVTVARRRMTKVRAAAAGAAVGLAVTALAGTALVRQLAEHTEPGWWLLFLGAVVTVLTLVGWAGRVLRWPRATRAALALAGAALLANAFVPTRHTWTGGVDARTALMLAAVPLAVAVAVRATVRRGGTGGRAVYPLAAVTIALLVWAADLFGLLNRGFDGYFSDETAVLLGLLLVALLPREEHADRVFVPAAQVAAAVPYLAFPIYDDPAGHTKVMIAAFGAIAVVALLGAASAARARGRVVRST